MKKRTPTPILVQIFQLGQQLNQQAQSWVAVTQNYFNHLVAPVEKRLAKLPWLKKVVKRTPRKIVTVSGAMILGIALWALVTFLSQPATVAAWFDYNWAYRVIYVLTNSSSAINAERKILVEVDTAALITAGKLQSDCDDARITDQDGKLLEYFIDTNSGACNTNSTDFYVKVPSVVTGKFSLLFYYGNPSATRGRSSDFFAIDTVGEGLQSYWKLNETSANTCTGGTNDSCDSAHTADGAWNANATNTTGIMNSGVTFDGTGDYIDAGQSGFTSTFTVSTWVNPSTVSSTNAIFGERTATARTWAVYIRATGEVGLTLAGNADYTSTGAGIAASQWQHIVVVVNGTSLTIYKNGVSVHTATMANTVIDSTAALQLGGDGNGNYFTGALDDVRIYPRALNLGEVTSIYNAGNPTEIAVPLTFTPSATSAQTEEKNPGPIGVWNMDEASGSTVYDSTQQANNGTFLTGTPISTGLPQQIELLNRNYTTTSTTFTPTDNSNGLAYYDSSKYTSPTAYFEAVIRQNQTNTTSNDVGRTAAIDCPTSDNCKIAYYEWDTSSLKFMDCDNTTCSTGTITIIDGTTGCVMSGCGTAEIVGEYIALDCVAADDCKIAYLGGASTDLIFVDCSTETCSSGTRTLLDGTSGCSLTGCGTRSSGYHVTIDCSPGTADCKIAFLSSGADVFFVDCDTATCSSGTLTQLDGGSGCVLTGCNTGISTASYTSLFCVTATDCKLAYFNDTADDLIFADCNNAACTSGSVTTVDGAASCPLTGCSTTDVVGANASLYCTASDDCKIGYYNSTDTDLYFADCDTATCSSGTTTLIEGNAGCALTGCITSGSSGGYIIVDCIGGSTDCKIGFFRTTTDDLRFADCSNATCSSGSITLVDGNTGCGLTGCSTTASTGHYAEMKCLSATDCKFVYQNDDLADLTFADCDSATCNSGTQQTIDGDGALKSVVGYYTDVDCTGGSSDCKIAYYDTTESALVFYDCDNATCSTGTLVYLDGKDGCTLTGCVTTADAGGYVALDCSTGVNDCKIAYYVDGSTDDLYFADCDSATCNVGTTRMIDGGASCPLTGCTTSATVGTHPNIDCSAGTADCKIAYKNETTDDLLFADCDTATCSSGTRTVVDGTTGCALTGCSTTNDVGINAALSCPTATDCKIAYYDNTRTSLRFADCDNAACTSGTASILEGDTGCLLTGCSTSTSSGTGTTIDCSPGASDCKIAYYNSTGGDLNFVDCNNATCTSGTISQLEGSAGCALTNCSTSVFADSPTIACGGDGSNCKVAYYRSYDFSFADCDNAACTSGTTTVLDGTNGCALTGCSTTNTFEIVFSLDCKAGLNDCKVAYHETDNGDIYFADCNNGTCASGTTNLADDGADRVWAQLVSSSGAAVPDGIITTRSSSYSRLRTPAISPTTATAYGIRLASTDSLNITADVRAARMIVSQSGALSATQTQVEVGNYETSTATSYTPLTNKKIYRYDANKFTPTPTAYFEATISNSTAGQTTSVALYSDGASCATVVSGSEVTVTGTTWTRVRSSAVTLNDDTDYMVCIKTTANTAQIANARVVLDQSGTIYGTELVYNLVNTAQTDVDTAYTSQNGLNYFDPALFSGSTNYYFESDIKTSAGTGYAQLYNSSDVTAVSSSEVSTTGTSYSRQRSNALTMPVAAKNLDTQLKNSSTNTTTVSSADLIVQAGSPPTSTPTRRTSESCYSNNCLEFNGSDNSVSITNTNALDLDQGLAAGVSFAGWVKVSSDGETNVGQIVSKGDSTYLRTTNEGSDRLVDLEASLDLASSDATVTITNGLPLNEWHHVALAYTDDGDDEVSVYIDGKLRGTSSNGSGAPASDGNDWLLGGSSSANFHGFIDEVRLYNYERTVQQVTLDYAAKGSSEGVSAQLGDGSLEKLNHGLVAYYPMDEAAANSCTNGTNDTCDKSGNGNDGAWNGDTTTGSGKFGNGVSLDGTGDYVSIPDSDSLDLTTTGTVAAWVKVSTYTTSYWSFISKGHQVGDLPGYGLWYFYNNNSIYGSIRSPANQQSSVSFGQPSVGVWSHLLLTWDGQKIYSYLNGSLVSTATQSGPASANSYALNLGRDSAYTGPHYQGSLDEVRIYNRALSPDEVQDLYNYAPGPVAHWKLDENTGTSAADASSNNNTGTLTNGPTWAPGKFGSGVKFDGSDDYISTSGVNSINGASQVSITYWIKKNNSNSIAIVGSDVNSTKGIWVSWWSDGYIYFSPRNGGSTHCQYNFGYSSNWQHITAVYDGTQSNSGRAKIYLNGIDTGCTIVGTIPTSLSSDAGTAFNIGEWQGSYTEGHIDDVRIYNYALSQKQIVNVMNGREGYEPAVGGSVGNPVLHLGFDDGYGTTAQDSSPQNNDGTLTNMAAPATATSGWSNSGKFGKALAFDGTNDYVSVGNNSSIIPASSISISTWAKFSSFPSDNTNTARVLVRNDSGYFLYVYGDVNDQSQLAFMLPDAMTAWSNVPIYNIDNLTTDTWYHIVGTWDGSTARLYINNKLVSSTLVSGSIASTDITRIGTTTVGTEYYMHGLIDEVKIYNYALTEDDIRLEYNRGAAVQLGATSTASNGTTPDNSSSREYCVPGDTATCNPPVAEWKFDENTGSTANDTSGNNNTGTLTNSPTWSPGKLGSAVRFDGVDDYVSIADSNSLDLTTTFTIEAWIKHSGGDNRKIITKGTSTGTTGAYVLDLTSSNYYLRCYVENVGITITGTTSLNDNLWHYVACSRDSDNSWKLYLDGKLHAAVSSSNVPSLTSQNFAIGAYNNGLASPFNGLIDQVRIYNYARTPAQIAWEYNRGAPIAHYKLDECQGTTAYNSALNSNGEAAGNNGTITIGASGSNTTAGSCKGSTGEAWKDGASGKFNSSLELDGTDDYVDSVGSVSSYSFVQNTGNFTVSAWVKRASTSGSEQAIMGSTPTNSDKGFYVSWNGNGNKEINMVIGRGGGNVATVTTSNNSLNDSNWHHILITGDGTTARSYIDGIANNTASIGTFSSGDSTRVLNIGRWNYSTPGGYWNGQIDDVRIYNYALTPAQVKDLYNGGAVNFR